MSKTSDREYTKTTFHLDELVIEGLESDLKSIGIKRDHFINAHLSTCLMSISMNWVPQDFNELAKAQTAALRRLMRPLLRKRSFMIGSGDLANLNQVAKEIEIPRDYLFEQVLDMLSVPLREAMPHLYPSHDEFEPVMDWINTDIPNYSGSDYTGDLGDLGNASRKIAWVAKRIEDKERKRLEKPHTKRGKSKS